MAIDPEELLKKKWPLPCYPIGHEVVDRQYKDSDIIFYDDMGQQVIAKEGVSYANIPYPADYCQSNYVQEGKITAVPIVKKEGNKMIPPGECGITSLVKDREGKIFGVTSGERVYLFVYNPEDEKTTPYAVDLGVVEDKSQACSLVIASDGRLFFGTRPESKDGHIYSYSSKDISPRIEKAATPVKDEGISAMVIDDKLARIYGLSSRSGTFFIFYPDTGKVELKEQVDKDGLFSAVLAITPDGDVFGAARWGRLFKYEMRRERLISLNVKAPSIRGREMYNSIDSLIVDKTGQSIYGGTSADGILFRFDIRQEKIVSLGKPLNQPRIRCLAPGENGCLYGIAGKTCCHLFKYNPADGELVDLGIVFVSSPRYWHGYEFDAAVTGKDGRIYLGQNERISYLFIYSPHG